MILYELHLLPTLWQAGGKSHTDKTNPQQRLQNLGMRHSHHRRHRRTAISATDTAELSHRVSCRIGPGALARRRHACPGQ